MSGCGCETRARWLSVKLAELSARFDTKPTLALAQLLTVLGLAAAVGYCYGATRGRTG